MVAMFPEEKFLEIKILRPKLYPFFKNCDKYWQIAFQKCVSILYSYTSNESACFFYLQRDLCLILGISFKSLSLYKAL